MQKKFFLFVLLPTSLFLMSYLYFVEYIHNPVLNYDKDQVKRSIEKWKKSKPLNLQTNNDLKLYARNLSKDLPFIELLLIDKAGNQIRISEHSTTTVDFKSGFVGYVVDGINSINSIEFYNVENEKNKYLYIATYLDISKSNHNKNLSDEYKVIVISDISHLYYHHKNAQNYLYIFAVIYLTILYLLFNWMVKSYILNPINQIRMALKSNSYNDLLDISNIHKNNDIRYLSKYLFDFLVSNDDKVRSLCQELKTKDTNLDKFTSLVSSFKDAIITIDKNHEVVIFNEEAEYIFRRKKEEVLGKNINILIPERFRKNHTKHVNSFLQEETTGRPMSGRGDIYAIRSNGDEFPVEISIAKYNLENEIYMSAIVRDISERRIEQIELERQKKQLEQQVNARAEQLQKAYDELKISEQRLNEAQRIGKIGSWQLDIKNDKLVWSDQIFRMFEIDPKNFDATFDAFIDTVHPMDRDTVKNAYIESIRTKTPYEITHRLLLPSGKIKFVVEKCHTKYDHEGKPEFSTGTVQDVSERVEYLHELENAKDNLEKLNKELENRVLERTQELELAKNKAESASKAKSDFLARISHELRTPLTAILGYGQLLRSKLKDNTHLQYVSEIINGSSILTGLIDELLDLSNIEQNKLTFNPSIVNFENISLDAINMCRHLISEKDVTIVNNVKSNCPNVIADRLRLTQVLINFISNAIKYSGDKIVVTLKCSNINNRKVRLTVQDNGPGIPEEDQIKIFRPFERLSKTKKNIEGMGIGLALAKSIIEQQNGEIGVYNCSDQGGACFYIEFDITDKEKHGENINSIIAEKENLKYDKIFLVLLVEDNLVNQHLMKNYFLEKKYIKLISASNGEDGYQMAKKEKPDLILMDINLPDIHGHDLLTLLRKDSSTRDIPVVALSADAMPEDIQETLDLGIRNYITKPIDFEYLEIVLKSYFDKGENDKI